MSERQRLYRTHAIILHRRDIHDADRVLTVFTPNYGKQEFIAKGTRKTNSRKAGHLEPFSHSALLVAQARTWDIIAEAVNIDTFPNLRTHLERISQAGYICELIDSFTETGDENQPVWDLLVLTLHALDALPPSADAHTLLHWFELHLLALAGFQPQIFQCLHCDKDLEPVTNWLSLTEGGIFCADCGLGRPHVEAIEADVLKVLRFMQTRPWSAVQQVAVRSHILQRVDNLLYRYLLTILERQLKSVDLMRRLEYMRHAAPPRPPHTPPPHTPPPHTPPPHTSPPHTDEEPHAHP